MVRATPGGRVGWQRQRAWMEVFSSAEMTNSPGSKRRLWNRRAYRSSTTAALAAKSGSRGKIQERCRQGLSASWSSQRHSVETETSLTRPLAIPQPAEAFFDKALAPLRHGVDRHPKPPGDPDVLLPIGGRQHDPGPHDLALLGG